MYPFVTEIVSEATSDAEVHQGNTTPEDNDIMK